MSVLTLGVLLALMVVATITDWRRQTIYNWTTYPGLVLGLLLRWLDEGRSGLEDAAWGTLGCGGIMLVCLVFFADLGGGDFKLLTMIGAFLGWYRGLEALLWTFVLGGIGGLSWVIWQVGVVEMARKTFRQLAAMWRAKGYVPLSDADREPLQRTMFLAPAALVAVVIVTWDVWW